MYDYKLKTVQFMHAVLLTCFKYTVLLPELYFLVSEKMEVVLYSALLISPVRLSVRLSIKGS